MRPAVGRQLHGAAQRGGERRHVDDGLVGRRHHQHRVAAVGHRLQRGQRQRGRGVAADRLEQHGLRFDLQLAQLVEDQEAVLLVADDQRRGDVEAVGAPAPACAARPAAAGWCCPTARGTASDSRRATAATGACRSRRPSRRVGRGCSCFESSGVVRLPAPAVRAHALQVVVRRPAQPLAGQRGVGVAGVDVARPARRERVGHAAAARLLVGAHHVEHAVAAAGAEVDGDRVARRRAGGAARRRGLRRGRSRGCSRARRCRRASRSRCRRPAAAAAARRRPGPRRASGCSAFRAGPRRSVRSRGRRPG